MHKDESTMESFQGVAIWLNKIAKHIDNLMKNVIRHEKEIAKLNSIIDELRDENERLKREAKGGDA